MTAVSKIDVVQFKGFMDETIIEATVNMNKKFLYSLWDEIVPYNPVRTGLSMYSWRMTPMRKSTYKPKFSVEMPGEGRVFPPPDRPNLEKYRRIFKKFYLFNNQDYVTGLNENEEKYYYMFIDNGIKRAIAKSNA